MKFLIVDPNRVLGRFLIYYLRGKGHTAIFTPGPNQIPVLLGQHQGDEAFDAVIIEPKQSGVVEKMPHDLAKVPEVVAAMKSVYDPIVERGIAVMAFSGMGYHEVCMQAHRQAGGSGYVSKGLGPSEIYSACMRVLKQHQSAPKKPHALPGSSLPTEPAPD